MDAGGFGAVLDGIEHIWYYPDANNQASIQIKTIPRTGDFIFQIVICLGIFLIKIHSFVF